MVRSSIHLITLAFPWWLRRWLLVKLLGYKIHPTANIGLAWVLPTELVMEANSKIGNFTVCKGMDLLHLKEYASIGKGNWISGYSARKKEHYSRQHARSSKLVLGEHAAITHRHLIDCTDSVGIGKFSIIAGYRTQILTHGIDFLRSVQTAAPVSIGDYCFVGTGCVILGGGGLPNYSVLGAMALLNRVLTQQSYLYGGIPAKPIKMISQESAYFARSQGLVI